MYKLRKTDRPKRGEKAGKKSGHGGSRSQPVNTVLK